jgi:hypothetical protein
MSKITKKQQAFDFLTSKGWSENTNARTTKYLVMSKPGIEYNYYLGKSGAVRRGRIVSASVSVKLAMNKSVVVADPLSPEQQGEVARMMEQDAKVGPITDTFTLDEDGNEVPTQEDEQSADPTPASTAVQTLSTVASVMIPSSDTLTVAPQINTGPLMNPGHDHGVDYVPPARTGLAGKLASQFTAPTTAPHVQVRALAGTGKTTTMIEGMRLLKGQQPAIAPSPQQQAVWDSMKVGKSDSIRFAAFGKAIATELQERLARFGLDRMGCEASTFHSMGYKAVIKAFGRQEPNKWTVLDIVAECMGKDFRDMKRDPQKMLVLNAVDQLVGLCKQNLSDTDDDSLDALAGHYDVDTNGHRAEIYDLVPRVLEVCKTPKGKITFDDMVWLPVVHNLPIYKTDMLLTDECVPGWTPVMLADGTSRTIEHIVTTNEEFYVRAYDTETGQPKNCKVIAKQKILNQKPLVKIKAKHHHKTGTNKQHNFVVCTEDHKVWTINRGWVEAGQIIVGDDVIIETAAEKSQKGKVTAAGRQKLAELQTGNKRGLGNPGCTPAAFNAIKGGNGRGPSFAEQTLLDALGEGWVWNHPVATGKRSEGYPTCYKIDIARPASKIAIEIDGHSHRGNKEVDAKKQTLLEEMGWTVYRFSNREAVQDAPLVAAQLVDLACPDGINCPRPATVVSVSRVTIPDNFVYDITVEDCHNFYANGVLVHNCQDLNRMQQALAYKAAHRIVMVGDENQAIFGFAGADAESMNRMRDHLRADTLPLTVTRRCGKAIVAEANRYVPEFEAHESNSDGSVGRADYNLGRPNDNTYHKQVRDGDFILCRVNAPLVNQCFTFLKQGRKANIQGRDIGAGLISTINKVMCKSNDHALHTQAPVVELVAKLSDWLAKETAKENAKRYPSETRIEALHDRVDCLICFTEQANQVSDVVRKIQSVFTDDKTSAGIKLSSIHRAKGLEAKNVFILQPKNAGMREDKMQEWEREQEANLRYVAITRAIDTLTYVNDR